MGIKLGISLLALLTIVAVTPASAYFYTMDFTNATLDLGTTAPVNLTNQYDAFGLSFANAYRYYDARDPWDDFGIANSGSAATVYFTNVTDSITFDWWTLEGRTFNLTAFDGGGGILGTYSGTGSGSHKIVASGISYLSFHDSGGDIAISNLSYDRSPAVPEPATAALFGLGLLGAGIYRRVKRKA